MMRRTGCSFSLLALILFLWMMVLLHPAIIVGQAVPLNSSPGSGAGKEPAPAPSASRQLTNDPGSELPRTSLASQDPDWKLVGTSVPDDPTSLRIAIIEYRPSRTQQSFQEGSHLGEHLVKRILDGAVVVSTQTGDALLSMADGRSAGASSQTDQVARLPRNDVDSTLPDETHLMQAIHVRPRFEGGQPGGFVIYSIEPNSIFARMGLRDGDVIMGMDGNSFTTTQPTIEFYEALKKGGTVSLDVKRGDSSQRLVFEIQ